MNRFTLFVLLLSLTESVTLHSQSKKQEDYYLLNEDWKGTTIDKARYIIRTFKINDTAYRWDTYNFTGPLIKSATTKDQKGEVPNGKFVFYNSKGYADSTGNYSNGTQNGTWYILNDTGRVALQKTYDMGNLVNVRDLIAEDSIKKPQPEDKKPANEKESEFPGAAQGWARFLNRNLKYPKRAINLQKQGQVAIIFTVTEEGKIEDAYVLRSVELTLDDEGMRMMEISPNWIPAVKDEKKVKSYKIQPIVFRLE